MNKDLIPFLMDMARLVPGVDMGAALARGVEGKGKMSDALAFLPFLGWAKKAKTGAKMGSTLMRRAMQLEQPAEEAINLARAGETGASALRAGEREWAQKLGGMYRPAAPMPLGRMASHEVGKLGVPFFQQYPASRSTDRLAEEMFANMERFK